ncbi:MAG: aminotransferase class I/II-fold pyridoxal phosphate-dependent enzyme [Phycisphaerae bacterium]|nr:aminotransferase class I/II-fold pyridoxal phosphate-dependent enzyme [Phycisphaerae bacterium]MDW8262989.1 aminotransferase class I/II-fold pyridoxal phosphate-dependent enzyme [Phycisphaerales bacterium]
MDGRRFTATRSAAVDSSGIRKVFDLAAKLKDPINLSIGLPDFDVPEPAKVAAVEAIRRGENRYTQTQGIAALRERLRHDLSCELGRDIGEVLITSGVSGGLFLAMLACIDPGDEVIFLDPYFVMYKHLLTLTGGVARIVDCYPDFRFPADRVAAAVTAKTKILILNSPANPTGAVMSPEEISAAVEIARRHDLLILSDEIYEPFLYETGSAGAATLLQTSVGGQAAPALVQRRGYSPAELYENTLILRGFSKSHAMTGWRVGYAAGPGHVIAEMTKLQQYTYVCAPSVFQHAALKALDVSMADAVAAYRRKRDIAYSILSRKFEVERPGGAFYIFPKVPVGTASEFCSRAIEKNVLIIPGNVFSSRDTHIRISYATSDEKLSEGCEILCRLV